ncbi:MAG: FMN-binding protein [Elusimicrobia bacterium]|nr:FMN-binding protein [Elusimicrobiota bacterium]
MQQKYSNLKMLAVLAGICVISAGLLGYAHISTAERIRENREARIRDAVGKVLAGIDSYERINSEPVIFKGMTQGEIAGYAVLYEGMGFQGTIQLLIGLDPDIHMMKGMAVLDSVETPGLGDRIKGPDFGKQFEQMGIPGEGEIKVDTITGATISSLAVEKIINRAIGDAKRIL